MSFSSAAIAQDWPALSALISERFGVDVGPNKLRMLCEDRMQMNARDLRRHWSDCSWACWFKSRIQEYKRFSWGSVGYLPEITTATLHVGFLWLEETPEMLARLSEPGVMASTVSRSKITETQRVIQPIDRVAARVARMEDA